MDDRDQDKTPPQSLLEAWMKISADFWGSAADMWAHNPGTSGHASKSRAHESFASAFKTFQALSQVMAEPEAMQSLFKGVHALPEVFIRVLQPAWQGFMHIQGEALERAGRIGKSTAAYSFENLDQEAFKAWSDVYEREFRQFLRIPQVGLLRVYQERFNEATDKFNVFHATVAEFFSILFLPVARRGLSDNYLHAKPMHARTVVSDILQGGYLAIPDATTDPRLENHDLKKAEGITSILVVPVMVKDRAIGVLSLYSKDFREFAPDEIAFLAALAEQGGMAIENARLFDRLNRNTRLFYDLASHMNSSLDIKQIMHILTEHIAEALDMKGVSVSLFNKDTGSLELMAGYGLSPEFLAKGPVATRDVVSQALEGQTVVIRDVAQDHRIRDKDVFLKEGIVSVLAVPVRSRDDVIGLMILAGAAKQEFPEDMIMLVNALAHQGGQAIQNASLYLLLQQAKKSLDEDIWSHKLWF